MSTLTGHDFEHVVAQIYRDNGYVNVVVSPGSGDFGVDVVASKGGIKYAIQVKLYSSKLTGKPIQEVVAGAPMWDCQKCIVVTNSTFTEPAKVLARGNNVELVDGDALKRMDVNNRFYEQEQIPIDEIVPQGHSISLEALILKLGLPPWGSTLLKVPLLPFIWTWKSTLRVEYKIIASLAIASAYLTALINI